MSDSISFTENLFAFLLMVRIPSNFVWRTVYAKLITKL